MDDADLTIRLALDLDGAFEMAVLGHQDRLYTIALRLLGDPREAEEVTQDALMNAYRALQGYDPDRRRRLRLRPWLASIVLNAARNRHRRGAGRTPTLRLDNLLATGYEPAARAAEVPEQRHLRHEDREAWARRLLRCPLPQRTALVLRHVDGLSYDEIAEILGRPVGTVKAQVHRGLAHLRGQLVAESAERDATPPIHRTEQSA